MLPPGPTGIMVQRKWDGDRLQAHIHPVSDGEPRVQLFTRAGRAVRGMYKDIVVELER